MRSCSPLLLLALLLLLACGSEHAPRRNVVRAPSIKANPAVEVSPFDVTYRETVNVFEILDNVSSWLPDKDLRER